MISCLYSRDWTQVLSPTELSSHVLGLLILIVCFVTLAEWLISVNMVFFCEIKISKPKGLCSKKHSENTKCPGYNLFLCHHSCGDAASDGGSDVDGQVTHVFTCLYSHMSRQAKMGNFKCFLENLLYLHHTKTLTPAEAFHADPEQIKSGSDRHTRACYRSLHIVHTRNCVARH